MTEELQVSERDVVIPGDVLAQGMGYLPGNGTYREQESIRANRIGLVAIDGKVIKLIPLSGRYMPKVGDKVIARVSDVLLSGWRVDLNCAYSAVLSTKDASSSFIGKGTDLTEYFDIGDYILTKIVNVTSQKLIDITMRGPGLRKLEGGRVIQISANKVPRVIGKEGTMIALLRQSIGCDIVTGQNGMVWLKGDTQDEILATQTIRKIERESQMSGLTNRIKAFLEENGKTVPDVIEVPQRREERQERDHHRGSRHGARRQPRGNRPFRPRGSK